jgi:glutaredoxin 3
MERDPFRVAPFTRALQPFHAPIAIRKRCRHGGGGARLARMADKVTLYVKTGCPYCAAKRLELSERGVTFTEVNVSEHPEVIPELLKLTKGQRLVPVIVEGSRIRIAPEGG